MSRRRSRCTRKRKLKGGVKPDTQTEDKKINQLLDKEYNRWRKMNKTEYVSELKKTLKTTENIRNYYASLVEFSSEHRPYKKEHMQAFDNLPNNVKRLEEIRKVFRGLKWTSQINPLIIPFVTFIVSCAGGLFGLISKRYALGTGTFSLILSYLANEKYLKPRINKTVKQLIHAVPSQKKE